MEYLVLSNDSYTATMLVILAICLVLLVVINLAHFFFNVEAKLRYNEFTSENFDELRKEINDLKIKLENYELRRLKSDD